MSLNLSYSQIEKIGKFLQKIIKETGLTFLKKSNFDQRFISKISQEFFGKIMNEELINKLSEKPYSLILDNSTFCGQNLCALKVRYLDQEWDEELKSQITIIQNKIISITKLKESSSGKVLKDIIEKRLFKHPNVKKNLLGFVHDNGSNIVGENIGTVTLLKKSGLQFYDLCDPCHDLNLVLKHSMKNLPSRFMDFVHDISNHFSSPQRKEVLQRIQKEKRLRILFPKQLVETRWLSVGQFLSRIIEIWESLIFYYELKATQKVPKKKKKQKKNVEEVEPKKK